MYQTLKIMVLGAAFFAGSCSVETPEHKTAACETDSSSTKKTTSDETSLALADATPDSYTSPSSGLPCSTCHGADGAGGVGSFPALDTYAASHTESEFQTIMANGEGSMPAYSDLPEAELDELWVWLQSFDDSGDSTTTGSTETETEEEETTTTTTTTTTEEEVEEEEEESETEKEDDDSSTSSSKSSKKKC